jgi:ankyrin repeat protein
MTYTSQSRLSLSLHQAVENGHEAAVQQLLANDQVDVNAKDPCGRTPLSQAAENGHEVVVQLLLANDRVDVNAEDNNGRTPMLRAAENGHEAVVQLLLENDQVNVNTKLFFRQTPLSLAAEKGHEAVVKLLLANNRVDVYAKDSNGRTPLSWAVENGHEAVVKLLFHRRLKDTPPETPKYLLLLWHIIAFLVFLARRLQTMLQIDLSLHRLSEFPNRLRPPCTTMPWNIRPALFVLWGVCWMFYTPPATPQPDQSHAIWYSEPLSINPGKYSHGNSVYNHFVLRHS